MMINRQAKYAALMTLILLSCVAAVISLNTAPLSHAAVQTSSSKPPAAKPAPKKIPDNRIIIKKIGVEAPLVETKDWKSALRKGMWRVQTTSQPDKGGNTVITGHRWLYKPPHKRTFYNLDKLKKGDLVTVVWYGVKYDYKVTETKVVKPTEVSILEQTKKPRLTLFTCTPLYSTKYRLVVIAEPISKPVIKK